MLEIPVVCFREKKAYTFSPVPSYIGNAVSVGKALAKHFELIHIIDKDIESGRAKNFDIYNALTYFTHVQVEAKKRDTVEKLQKVEARCVVDGFFDAEGLDRELLVADMRSSFYKTAINDILVSEQIYLKHKDMLEGKRVFGWDFKEEGLFGFVKLKKWEERSAFLPYLS